MASSMQRQKNPSIDGQQFVVRADTESATTTSSTSSTTSLEEEQEEELHYNHGQYNQENFRSLSENRETLNEDGNPITNISSSQKKNKHNRPLSDFSSSDGGLLPSNFNAVEYLINSLYNSLDSIELDRALVIQSQLSGKFNNTSNEILTLIDEIKDNLNEHIRKYENLKKNVMPEIVSNINKSTKLSHKLTTAMKQMYPVEYSKSQDKVMNRITNEEEDLYI